MALVLLLMQGCHGRTEKTAKEKSKPIAATEQVARPADTHTSQNALDYEGTYEGTIPCADCPGINATVVIDRAGNYSMTYVYEGKDTPAKWSGKYTWSADGRSITLKGAGDRDQRFQVGENVLFMLDGEGKRITGEHADKYILRKKTE